MKRAHWAKVTKAIAKKYSLNWTKAKTAFKVLNETETRKPSLRMVSDLPAKFPAKLKGVRKKQPNPTKSVKTELPPGVSLAPKAKTTGARPVPQKQTARNKFERLLLEFGLPIAAIARNSTGKQLAANWRDEKEQEKLAKLLNQAYRQIERTSKSGKQGYMLEQTKERLTQQMEKILGVQRSNIIWNNIMKQLYGVSAK